MGQKLFGVDLSGIVAKSIGKGLPSVTLVKVTTGTREPGNQAGGTQPTTVSYLCKGLEVELEQRFIDGDMVKITDVAVLLLGDTIDSGNVVPQAGDRVISDGKTRSVVRLLERDPAKATYLLAVRGP